MKHLLITTASGRGSKQMQPQPRINARRKTKLGRIYISTPEISTTSSARQISTEILSQHNYTKTNAQLSSSSISKTKKL